MNELLDVQLSKSELVRRARALNQLAIGYRLSSSQREQAWSDDVRKRRDELMLRARAIWMKNRDKEESPVHDYGNFLRRVVGEAWQDRAVQKKFLILKTE